MVQVCLDRPGRDAEPRGRLGGVEVDEVAQRHDLALARRQLTQGVDEVVVGDGHLGGAAPLKGSAEEAYITEKVRTFLDGL